MRSYRRLVALYAGTVLVIVAVEGVRHVDNNFAIFRASFAHLAAGRDLYARYPAEHADLFKYSPTFALLFAPFALVPVLPALALWSAVNVFALVRGVRRVLPPRDAALALALVYLEVVRTTQRAQDNALVTGLMILGFVGYERRRPLAGAAAVAAGTFVKIFPLATFAVAVFQPRRWRAALLGVLALLLGLALPLAVTSPARLAGQYASWAALEATDARADAAGGGAGLYGGVMAQLRLWWYTSRPERYRPRLTVGSTRRTVVYRSQRAPSDFGPLADRFTPVVFCAARASRRASARLRLAAQLWRSASTGSGVYARPFTPGFERRAPCVRVRGRRASGRPTSTGTPSAAPPRRPASDRRPTVGGGRVPVPGSPS